MSRSHTHHFSLGEHKVDATFWCCPHSDSHYSFPFLPNLFYAIVDQLSHWPVGLDPSEGQVRIDSLFHLCRATMTLRAFYTMQSPYSLMPHYSVNITLFTKYFQALPVFTSLHRSVNESKLYLFPLGKIGNVTLPDAETGHADLSSAPGLGSCPSLCDFLACK